ncbi:MAG TPA: hypothetical protein VGL76_09755 [Gaiellaceae bacterium]
MTPAQSIEDVRMPEELFDLLDPDVLWYSSEVDSNYTCNDKDDVIACIERGLEGRVSGRFEVVGERDDFVVVRAVTEPPRDTDSALLLRFRDGLIVEMRDFVSPAAALRYAGIGTGVPVG